MYKDDGSRIYGIRWKELSGRAFKCRWRGERRQRGMYTGDFAAEYTVRNDYVVS